MRQKIVISLVLFILVLFPAIQVVAVSDTTDVMYSEADFRALFDKVKRQLTNDLADSLDELEEDVFSSVFLKAWAVSIYDDATPAQYDLAYKALFYADIFLGLAAELKEPTDWAPEVWFLISWQVLDMEYYELLSETLDIPAEKVAEIATLRDTIEQLADQPDLYSQAEKELILQSVYAENYAATALRAQFYAAELPDLETLLADRDETFLKP